jgi:hypothetical protein
LGLKVSQTAVKKMMDQQQLFRAILNFFNKRRRFPYGKMSMVKFHVLQRRLFWTEVCQAAKEDKKRLDKSLLW